MPCHLTISLQTIQHKPKKTLFFVLSRPTAKIYFLWHWCILRTKSQNQFPKPACQILKTSKVIWCHHNILLTAYLHYCHFDQVRKFCCGLSCPFNNAICSHLFFVCFFPLPFIFPLSIVLAKLKCLIKKLNCLMS